MEKRKPTREDLLNKIHTLEERLLEAEETIQAIRCGEVDALIIQKPDGEHLYTLTGADHGYRILAESIMEGALILSSDDSVYYCNSALGRMLGLPIQNIISKNLVSYVALEHRSRLRDILNESRNFGAAKGEFLMPRMDGTLLPVSISLNCLFVGDFEGVCAIVTDLTQQKNVEEELRRHRTELELLVDERTVDLQLEILERRRAEEEVRGQREWLRVTLTSIGDAVIATDASARITFINPVAARLTGWPETEGRGRPIHDVFRIVNERSKAPCEDIVGRVLRDGRTAILSDNASLITRDGREIPVEDSAAPIRDGSGNLIGVVLVFQDVSEMRGNLRALHESEARYRSLFENSLDGILLTLPDGQIEAANPAASAMFQMTEEELRRVGRKELIGDSDPRRMVAMEELNHSGKTGQWESGCVRKDGTRFIAEASSVIFEEGKKSFMMLRDITDRKRAEKALEEAKEEAERRAKELAALMDAVPAMTLITRDPECLSMTGSRVTYDLLRLPLGANLSVTDSDAEPSPHFKFLKDGGEIPSDEFPMCVAARGREVHDYEMEISFQDGPSRIILGHATPLRDEAGQPYGAVGAFMDITERKEMEDELRKSHHELDLRIQERTSELRQAVVKLESMNQELQEFAFIASHDLQEPLRKIQTFGDILIRGHKESLNVEGQDHMARIIKGANRMSELLSALLRYSRTSTSELKHRPVSLAEVARDAASDLENPINHAGGRVEIAEMPTVDADAALLRQLFQNLIENSMKYRRESEAPVVKIHGSADDAHCRVTIEDNGIGFEDCYGKQIFRPFERLHGKSSPYTGTGMGLAICRKIVAMHGGDITVNSVPGQGTTFIVTLPLVQKT